ncbi:Uncharacterised protein [uncultured archaeon]|nr:Uncharacterised protein [uncultured archaeon]
MNAELVKDTTLDKVIDCIAGTLATAGAPLLGGLLISQAKEDNNYMKAACAVLSAYALYKVGQYFFSPRSERT